MMRTVSLAVSAIVLAAHAASAQPAAVPPSAPAAVIVTTPVAPPYGAPLSLVQARQVIDAAEAEARRRGFTMAFAVVEPSGELAAFARMDGVQYGSIAVSQEKARTAARFRRATKVWSDAVAGGRTVVLGMRDVIPIEGGVLLIQDGRVVGALGVSGGTSDQDGAVANAAAAAAFR